MKKQPLLLLSVLTALLAAFTGGFLLGRNRNHETMILTTLPAQPRHLNFSAPTLSPEADLPDISFPVDLNSASQLELSALPGIGEILARRILNYRETCGPFERPEDLMNVEGIGTAKLEAILDYVTTGG